MRYFPALILISIIFQIEPVRGQSTLLESVKRNPNEAKVLCDMFRSYNSKGISSSSKEVIDELSKQKKLSPIDAEILSIYVIGMHCPEVK